MNNRRVTATAHPNIAFIKYWGNAISDMRLPSNGSISMNLKNLTTITSAILNPSLGNDELVINGKQQSGAPLFRVQAYLDKIRQIYNLSGFISIESENNFPMAAGIASSASAFAALATVIDQLYEMGLSESARSTVARLGSGSACRSIPPGFCEWVKGHSHETSFSESLAPETHWNLYDCILVISKDPKKISSTHGHSLADTSPLQSLRVHDALRRLEICRDAILKKDFEKLAHIIEQDSNMMHAVMMTSTPPIIYWKPASIGIMHEVILLRRKGIAAAYTMDAGSNVHVICTEKSLPRVISIFNEFPGVEQMIVSKTGSAANIS